MTIKNICVFCSASNSLDKNFYNDASLLGQLLGQSGYNIVYGGSKLGLMYKVAKNAQDSGSKVIGIMPEKLYDLGVSEEFCDEFHLTKGMRERKAKLDEVSDGVVALAGGFGTLEEVSEMIVQKQLCYNNKPIVFLNTDGFYDELLRFFDNIFYKKFAHEGSKNLYYVAKTPYEVIDYLKNYKPLKKELKDAVFNK